MVLDNQAWSMSKLKMLESCSLNFYLSYILKLDPEGEQPDTLERDLGITMHYLLELMQSGHTIQEAYVLTEQKYRDVVGLDNWSRVIGALPNIRKFNRMMHDKEEIAGGYLYVEPEKRLAINRDYEPVDFFSDDVYFRGVIDYTAAHNDKSIVIDFKKGGAGYLTKYHSPQLTSYHVLNYFGNEKFKTGESFIYYIESGELSRGPTIEGEMIESHSRPWLDNKIETAIRQVQDDGYFKYTRGNACKYCSYNSMCTEGKRGTSGKLQEFEIQSKEIL